MAPEMLNNNPKINYYNNDVYGAGVVISRILLPHKKRP